MSSPSDCPPGFRKAWSQYLSESSPRDPGKRSDRLTDEQIAEEFDDVLDSIDLTEPPNLYSPDLSIHKDPTQGEPE